MKVNKEDLEKYDELVKHQPAPGSTIITNQEIADELREHLPKTQEEFEDGAKRLMQNSRYVVRGTIGHVDHGRTTLTAAIASMQPTSLDVHVMQKLNEPIITQARGSGKLAAGIEQLKTLDKDKKIVLVCSDMHFESMQNLLDDNDLTNVTLHVQSIGDPFMNTWDAAIPTLDTSDSNTFAINKTWVDCDDLLHTEHKQESNFIPDNDPGKFMSTRYKSDDRRKAEAAKRRKKRKQAKKNKRKNRK